MTDNPSRPDTLTIGGATVIVVLLLAQYTPFLAGLLPGAEPVPFDPAPLLLATLVTTATLIVFRTRTRLLVETGRRTLRWIGIRDAPAHRWIRWISLGVLTSIVVLAVTFAIAAIPPGPHGPDPRHDRIAAAEPAIRFLHGLLWAPLPEEILFRGLPLLLITITYQIRRPAVRTGIAWAIAIAATLAFGLIHAPYGWHNLANATLAGALFLAITVRTRSLVPVVTAHAITNGVLSALL